MIEPLSGSLVKEKLPVFTQSVQEELNGIIQRKYEVIDHQIPEGIEQTAAHVVKGRLPMKRKRESFMIG